MPLLAQSPRRPGISLTEALIAVAIMTIGLLAIMAFFPLAAFQMSQAFQADRSTALVNNADQLFRLTWKTAWDDPNYATKIGRAHV